VSRKQGREKPKPNQHTKTQILPPALGGKHCQDKAWAEDTSQCLQQPSKGFARSRRAPSTPTQR